MSFHQEAIQSMDLGGGILVSVASQKECSVVVWDSSKYTSLATSYTLDRINRVRVSPFQPNHFLTVGYDQLQVWKLEGRELFYYDVFLKGEELLCAEYVSGGYLAIGCQSGLLSVLDTTHYKTVLQLQVSNSPISNLVSHPDRLVLTANHVFYLDHPVAAIAKG